jgi:hypothetical protein
LAGSDFAAGAAVGDGGGAALQPAMNATANAVSSEE